jgi:type IV pilus biogenesis protein CpaD/CtpE
MVTNGMGTAMDSTALQQLIAQVRSEAATLAEAQRKVAAFTSELAMHPNGGSVRVKEIDFTAKRPAAGWMPAGGS